jgi:outer membrane protein assembly factor BamA
MGRAGLLQTSVSSGTDLPYTTASNDEGTAPGLVRSPDFVHLSGGAWLELRDEPGNPHRGAALGVAFSRFDERHGNAFHFNRTSVDVREYFPLGSRRHVVALRQVASLDDPDAGSSVPFYMQSTLGGSRLLRGYDSHRFRDDKLLTLAAEYRFELHPKVELALIYEAGKVFPTMREFDLRNLLRSWGAGIRLKSPREVRFRLDVLHSPEGTRMDVKLGQSF